MSTSEGDQNDLLPLIEELEEYLEDIPNHLGQGPWFYPEHMDGVFKAVLVHLKRLSDLEKQNERK